MALHQLGHFFRRAAVVAALATSGMSVQAAVYTGTWDPAYGTPFPNVGWRGEATFDIPDVCGTTGTLFSFTCAGMKVLDATVEFYDLNETPTLDPNWAPATIATLSWMSPTATVNVASFAGGTLATVATTFMDGFLTGGRTTSATLDGLNAYSFHLEFLPGGARLTHIASSLSSALVNENCARDFGALAPSTCGYSSFNLRSGDPVPMKIALAVPEPGTYALMLAGLVAVGVAARRRRVD